MTPGTDKETLDGFSLKDIREIIQEMKTEQFRFRPVRHQFIPKPNGKMRKLGIPDDYINVEEDEHAAASVVRVNRGMQSVPTIVFPDGSILVEPGARQLAAKRLQDPPPGLTKKKRHCGC
jgi:hypothetical protein